MSILVIFNVNWRIIYSLKVLKWQICNTAMAPARQSEKFTFKGKQAAPNVRHPLSHECDRVSWPVLNGPCL